MTGLVEDDSIDGFVLFHSKEITAREDWALDIYAGQDGVYLSMKDDLSYGKKAQTRLELFGRTKAFYREGYYEKGDYLISGQYEGRDYGLRLSSAQNVDEGLILDIGAFYKVNEFSRNAQTEFRPDFEIPDDFNTYGATLTVEQNTVKLDRILGLPQSGALMTVMAEYELNDSDKSWGSSAYTTKTTEWVLAWSRTDRVLLPQRQVWRVGDPGRSGLLRQGGPRDQFPRGTRPRSHMGRRHARLSNGDGPVVRAQAVCAGAVCEGVG